MDLHCEKTGRANGAASLFAMQGISSRTWWARPGLDVREGRLHIAGRDAEGLARGAGTPLYAHDGVRVIEQAIELSSALDAAQLRGVVRLALKAQREPEILSLLRERAHSVGLDVCSPGEIRWGLDHESTRPFSTIA